jgi:hypothetical protein
MSDFDYAVRSLVAEAELQLTKIEVYFDANWGVRPVNTPWATFLSSAARQRGDGRPFWKPSYELSVAEGRPWKGNLELDDGDHILGPSIALRMFQYGRRVNTLKAAMIDLDGWRIAPAKIQRAIDLEPSRVFARHWNWGHKILDWTGSYYFKNSSGNKKYSNPKNKRLPKWYNAIENQSAVPIADRIDAQLQLLNEVRGIDGDTLGIGEDGKRYAFLPTSKFRAVEKALGVLQLVPSTDGVTGGGGNTSKIFGDAIPVHVPWLRSDVIIVGAAPTDELMMPFAQLRGALADGTPQINEDVEAVGKGQPEFETVIFDTSSEMYKTKKMMGFGRLHYRGYGLGSPHNFNVSYDTLSTTTADSIVYNGDVPRLY